MNSKTRPTGVTRRAVLRTACAGGMGLVGAALLSVRDAGA